MKKLKNINPKLSAVGALVVLVLLLELVVRLFAIPAWLLPAPSEVLDVLWQSRAVLWHHSQRTVGEAALGLGLAAALGIGVGIATAQSKVLRPILYPLLVISQTIPLLVLAPLLAVWLGFGLAPKLIVVVLACFFPVALDTVVGLEGADREMIRLVESMGADRGQVFWLVKLPQAWPAIFGGLRVAASYCVTAAVVAEWMGSDRGLGIYLLSSAHAFKTASVFAGISIIVLASLFFFALVEATGKLAPPREE
jgi:ABC-type nitrate/sulfonate/bicarbonate transport system permease component